MKFKNLLLALPLTLALAGTQAHANVVAEQSALLNAGGNAALSQAGVTGLVSRLSQISRIAIQASNTAVTASAQGLLRGMDAQKIAQATQEKHLANAVNHISAVMSALNNKVASSTDYDDIMSRVESLALQLKAVELLSDYKFVYDAKSGAASGFKGIRLDKRFAETKSLGEKQKYVEAIATLIIGGALTNAEVDLPGARLASNTVAVQNARAIVKSFVSEVGAKQSIADAAEKALEVIGKDKADQVVSGCGSPAQAG